MDLYKKISDDSIESASLESLILTAETKYVLMEKELRGLDLVGHVPFDCDPIQAVCQLKKRVKAMQANILQEKIAARIQIASHTTMVCVSKQNVLGDYILQEKVEGQFYEEVIVGPVIVDEASFFAKSIVIDAREVDPENSRSPPNCKEINVVKAEIVVRLISDNAVSLGYTFSGYDKGYGTVTRKCVMKRLSESPAFYIDGESQVKEVRVLVDIPDVRAYYALRCYHHRKFQKYNPRQYCYFTLYCASDGPVGDVTIILKRLYNEENENRGLIYRGPDIRKGVAHRRRRHKYRQKPVRWFDQTPSPMTDLRSKVARIDFSTVSLPEGELSCFYSLERIKRESNVIETVDEDGVHCHRVHQSVTYSIKAAQEIKRELIMSPFVETCDQDYEDNEDCDE